MPRVLVIDDAIHIRHLIARILDRANIRTIQANDGVQGLKILKEQKPDVVTCDIAMPLMDGYEFLLAVKKDPEVKSIPIVIITALGQGDEVNKVKQMGADACITKPFSSSHLLETIQAQLVKHLD